MVRVLPGMTVVVLLALGAQADAASRAACPPLHPRRHHVAARRMPPQVVYGRHVAAAAPPAVYNYEDNGRYDGADLPAPPAPRRLAYGQQPSWLDGYGTRPVTYGAYGTYNVYGGSAQVMPYGLPPAGGLAVYEPGAYGPGPSIIHVPADY